MAQPAPRRGNSNQKSGVRLALATGATLAVLFSAQIFASADSNASSTSSTSTTQQTLSRVQTDDDGFSFLTGGSQGGLFQNNSGSQPSPRTHSSR